MKKPQDKKIFFVYPPSIHEEIESGENFITEFSRLETPPCDFMMLSTIAKKRNYKTKFFDYGLKNQTIYDFIRDLRNYKPDFLVLKVDTKNLQENLSVLNYAQELLEKTVVIVKGEIFKTNSFSILQKYPQIDIALKEEAEKAFDEIIQNCPLNEIEGITYQINNKITSTKNRYLEDNINYLPFLDIELIDKSDYLTFDTKKPQVAIEIARTNIIKNNPDSPVYNLRYKSTRLIVEEIRQCVQKYDIKDFIFLCDFFNFDEQWIKEFCWRIIESDLKISFQTCINLNNLNEDTLKLMKKAGCRILSFDIESANKKLSQEQRQKEFDLIKKQVNLISKNKIQTCANYITGLPWETKETILQTYKFAKELNTLFAAFKSAKITNSSKYFNLVTKTRLTQLNKTNPFVCTNTQSYTLNAHEIKDYNKLMNKNYRMSFKHFIKIAFEIDSIVKFKSYFKSFSALKKLSKTSTPEQNLKL